MQEIDYSVLGMRMKEARRAAGLTQSQLADRMNVSVRYYCAMENGQAHMSFTRFVQFLALTRVSADSLLLGAAPGLRTGREVSTVSGSRAALEARLDTCSDETIETLDKLLAVLAERL